MGDHQVWGHSSSSEPDMWTGSFATRDEAIKDGVEAYEGERFYVVEGVLKKASNFLPAFLIEDILERMAERAGEECGEITEGWPGTTSVEADQELAALLAAWADKHLTVEFWHAEGTPEEILGEVESEAVND